MCRYKKTGIGFLSILFISLVSIISCEKEPTGNRVEMQEGHFYNSNFDHVLKSIEIINLENEYLIKLHYSDKIMDYRVQRQGNEIVLNLNNDRELHLQMNGSELRVFSVVEEKYQPEDVTWTFYRKEQYKSLQE